MSNLPFDRATPTHQLAADGGDPGGPPLRSLFHPRSIAVVGASDDPARIGGRTISYLKQVYRGRLYPIHPSHSTIQGIPAFEDLSALPETPDLVTVAVAAGTVPIIAQQAATAGAGALLVFSAGFAESDDDGARLQAQLIEISERSGMRICGPNCIGLINVADGVFATFSNFADLEFSPGPFALVSQSGAFGIHVFKLAQRESLKVGYFCSTGNEADINSTQLLAHLVEQPEVHILMAIVESIKEPNLFAQVAHRSRELDKALLLFKMGTSEVGARAAMSHTSSISGSDKLTDAFLAELGILRPRTMRELLDWARAFQTKKRPRGNRVGIVTLSGGAGILMADAAPRAGLTLPEVPPAQQAHLETMVPTYGATSNPIDCTGQVVNDFTILEDVLHTVAECSEFDTVVMAGLPDQVHERWLQAVDSLARVNDKPLFVWCGGEEWSEVLAARSIPAFSDPSATIDAAGALCRFAMFTPSAAQSRLPDIARQERARQLLAGGHQAVIPGPIASSVVSLYGIALPAEVGVSDAAEAVRAAEHLGYPVALKVMSHDMPHKSEHGGVVLGITTDSELVAAYERLARLFEGALPSDGGRQILVQEMVAPGIELVCGMQRDPMLGPFISIGLGGTLVEIIGEASICPAPLGTTRATEMIAELFDGRLANSARGLSHQHQAEIAAILVALGELAVELSEVNEIDFNPVIASGDHVYTVDVLMTTRVGPDKSEAPEAPDRARQ